MSLEYPDSIDPQKAADGHRTFSGTIALSRMDRLKEFLVDDIGEVRFTAVFDKDPLVGVKVQVDVDAVLWLLCQRSLEPYQEVVKRSSLLGVVEDISQEALLPEGYEAILAEHGKISFLVMVEDELLLALPQVPRNPELPELDLTYEESAVPVELSDSQPRQQPFARLADQLKEFARSSKKPTGTGNK